MESMLLKRAVLGLVCVAVGFSASACATIIHGSSQKVDFASTPPEARVLVDGRDLGKTPITLKLARKDNHTVRIELEGYQPFEIRIEKELSGWYLGNLVFGGVIGLIVDPITGAMYKLSPKQIAATMTKASTSVAKQSGTLFVGVSLERDPEWERIGTMTRAGLR
jgi:hypothetical protein